MDDAPWPAAATAPVTPGRAGAGLPGVGDAVLVRFSTWDGADHWHYDAGQVISVDERHVVVGHRPGTRFHRPGRGVKGPVDLRSGAASVMAFARDDWYVATLNAPGWPGGTRVYVDISTVPQWRHEQDAWVVTMVDLDLDVCERRGEAPFIDDEDEFAEHQVCLGYPPEIVAAARATADRLLAEARAGRGFFGAEGEAWLARFTTSLG